MCGFYCEVSDPNLAEVFLTKGPQRTEVNAPREPAQSNPGESKILIYGDTSHESAKVKNTGLEVEARWTCNKQH